MEVRQDARTLMPASLGPARYFLSHTTFDINFRTSVCLLLLFLLPPYIILIPFFPFVFYFLLPISAFYFFYFLFFIFYYFFFSTLDFLERSCRAWKVNGILFFPFLSSQR